MTASRSCDRAPRTEYRLRGFARDYLLGITEQWLLVAPRANPGMLEMFRERDRLPLRRMVPWAGEFAGKYLTSAVQVLRVTGDPKLKSAISAFVAQLVALQDIDGYLGPWPRKFRLTGKAPNLGGEDTWKRQGYLIDKPDEPKETWDAWGHYHVMLGLLLWHDDTGDSRALRCAAKIGDLFCRKFLGRKKLRLVDTGSTEMNLAPIHALALLHTRTRRRRYLDLALQIATEFAETNQKGEPLAGNYLRAALDGKEFFEMPKPRWESLHPILALVELFRITGDASYRDAFEHIWWSILKTDRHNNGGFSSGERARGNPYHRGEAETGQDGYMETCCTIAWMAMSVEMLKLTGESIVADELELSTLNFVIGCHSHTGRWVTYDTPMDGVRKASFHQLAFQSREGTPELNCCSVNGPRGFGMIGDWALLRDEDGLVLNWYGACSMRADVRRGLTVAIEQETDYPVSGRIRLHVSPSRRAKFSLKLRIPYWSATTRMRINGRAVADVIPGQYLSLHRVWKRGDEIQLDLDLSLHFWTGENECDGKVSVYRGPILLTYDRRYNKLDPKDIPVLDAKSMSGSVVRWNGCIPPILLMEFAGAGGKRIRLCDFGSAGEAGSPYVSWLNIRNAPHAQFSRENPLRSAR